ncbi:hypothetical protein [Terrabacter sp. BE26]|uniref:hypothetical protein n=1 Tax=Terrabacter sp. BE26 TaxID=2898152 RepID=UPI0035BE8D6A
MALLPDPWASLSGEIRAIKQRLDELARRSPWTNTGMRPVGDNTTALDLNLEVQDTGRISAPEGGSLLLGDLQGRTHLYSGGLATNGFGTYLQRINGTQALTFADSDPVNESVQRIALADSDGKPLLAEDAAGSGAAWPLAPIQFRGLSWPTWSNNNGAAFVSIEAATTYKTSPRLYVSVQGICDSTAAGEMRLLVNGTQLGATVALPNLALTGSTFGTPAALPGAIGDGLSIELQTRVTSGTGKAYGRVLAALFQPSA